ncbi:ParB/RepB/Spo0J family partition protein [Cellulomonas sp. Leaf334]|uniref:ParB/RepB/Spo0J family partition protein n=1 Tax=Cellulomonas sp. Leaf334 TaxID=1736339 RepID=UPI0006F9B0C0|nr:ParB/RepB/Spo0J family partition protein [Cellulomonas sp. Leaf334]KQR17183.1 chromosome partitioning protein ParB [Cellulomonas sp. Leaf334]
MSEKRRGLGRGLGALIPTGLDGQRPTGAERPADVFFGDPKRENNEVAAPAGAVATETVTEAPPAEVETATATPAAGSNGTPSADVLSTEAASPVEQAPAAPAPTAPTPAEVNGSETGLVPVPGARFAELPVGEIRPNPKQPRTVFDEDALEELVGSIREVGVLQPIVVRDAGDGYELIMGERRWRATQAAGLATIPAIIRDTDDSDLLRDALLENLHRSELNPLEEAAAYQQLLDDFGCTHEQLATRIQRSRPQISNTLRLLKLPPLVQRRVAAGVLSAGHARALLGLSDGAAIERLAQRIVAEGLSVRAVEEIVSLGGDAEPTARRAAPRAGVKNEALDHLAARLSDRFETRVKVSLGKSRGRLTVEFASVQDLNRILASLAPEDPGLLKG